MAKLATRLACCAILAAGLADAQAPAAPYDGRWAVSLVCPDARDNKGNLVKGFVISFFGTVKESRLVAQDGTPGQPSSLVMTGDIRPDGAVEVAVNGWTGPSEYTFGKVASGTPYSYRMKGTFTASGGKATRVEMRPCEATFLRE